MAKFKKKTKVSQEIPTSALPDIIFILLFFFMVVTTVKEKTQKVITLIPDATQVQDLDSKKEQISIFIGVPNDPNYGSEPVIQIEDRFVKVEDIQQYIDQIIGKMPAKRRNKNNLLVYIKADENVKMGIVTDVKQILRKHGVLNIDYATIKKSF